MAEAHVEAGGPGASEAPKGASNRAQLLAELEKLEASDTEQPDAPVEDASSSATQAGASGAQLDEADEEAPSVEAKLDPETAKRVAALQKQEKRQREALQAEREAFKRERDEFEAKRSQLQARIDAFEQKAKRAKYDPASVLSELGLSEDEDFEAVARDLYARSKAGAAKPENREAAIRMQREREQADQVTALQRQIEELRAERQAEQQQREYQKAWDGWYGSVQKAANDEAPLFKAALTKNPAKAEQQVQALAAQLFQATGEWPDAADVITHYEKLRRAELEELGIDPTVVVKQAKPLQTFEGKNKPTRVLANGGGETKPKADTTTMSRAERRAAMIRELEQLDKQNNEDSL